MTRIGPGTLFVTLLGIAGTLLVLQLANARVDPHWFATTYDSLILGTAKYAFEGCIAFGALFLYLPSKTSAETLRKAWTDGLVEVGNDILGRAESAREALETLTNVGRSTPEQLPTACTAEFSEIASYCAGWRAHNRRRYWSRPLSAMLEESNRALFDFILTLEISKPPHARTLEEKHRAAVASLEAVIAELRKVLQIPPS